MSQTLIGQYLSELDRLRQVSGSRRESVLREAFKDLLKAWGRCPTESDASCPGDVDGNGVVNGFDLAILLDGSNDTKARNPLERATRVRDRVIVLLGPDTGLPTGEVCRLTVGDVHLDGDYLEGHESKWDDERFVPISPEVRAAVRRYLRLAGRVITRRDGDAVSPDEPLFLGRLAEPLTENGLCQALVGRTRGGGTGRFGLHRLRQRRGIGDARSWFGQADDAIPLRGVSFLATASIAEDTPPPASATKIGHSPDSAAVQR